MALHGGDEGGEAAHGAPMINLNELLDRRDVPGPDSLGVGMRSLLDVIVQHTLVLLNIERRALDGRSYCGACSFSSDRHSDTCSLDAALDYVGLDTCLKRSAMLARLIAEPPP